jgi:hypothetical protein
MLMVMLRNKNQKRCFGWFSWSLLQKLLWLLMRSVLPQFILNTANQISNWFITWFYAHCSCCITNNIKISLLWYLLSWDESMKKIAVLRTQQERHIDYGEFSTSCWQSRFPRLMIIFRNAICFVFGLGTSGLFWHSSVREWLRGGCGSDD